MTTHTELAGEDIFQMEMQEDLIAEHGTGPFAENFEEKVHHAQEKLLQLRRQQEMLERQKRELEELGIKQEQFVAGREDLADRLNRSLVMLEREAFDAQKKVEIFLQTRDQFANQLAIIESLNPDDWDKQHLREELTRSLTVISESRDEYEKSMLHINSLKSGGGSNGTAAVAGPSNPSEMTATLQMNESPKDFGYWLRSGFAFTLPLLLFGLIALILLFIK